MKNYPIDMRLKFQKLAERMKRQCEGCRGYIEDDREVFCSRCE